MAIPGVPTMELSEIAKKSPSLKKLKDMKERVIKEIEEAKSHSAAAESHDADRHRERVMAMTKDKKGARESDQALLQQEKLRHDMDVENKKLREMIALRQETAIRREECFQNEVKELKNRLDRLMLATYDDDSLMPKLHNTNKQIQQEAQQLKGVIETQAEIEKIHVIRAYRVKMHELKKMLSEEKHHNYMGVQEWIERNKFLDHELSIAASDCEKLKEKSKALHADNKSLKIAFQNQELQRQTIVKSITIIKKENQRLEDQIEKLEFHALHTMKKREQTARDRVGSSRLSASLSDSVTDHHKSAANVIRAGNNSSTASSRGESAHIKLEQSTGILGHANKTAGLAEKKCMEAIARVKHQLEVERKELKKSRAKHMTLLAERTELELFLRQCIDDVRKEIARNTQSVSASSSTTGRGVEGEVLFQHYSDADRKRVLEILMSKERVLSLLYTKTFPAKLDIRAAALAQVEGRASRSPSPETATRESSPVSQ